MVSRWVFGRSSLGATSIILTLLLLALVPGFAAAQGAPYVLGVSALGSGTDELERWEPVVAMISGEEGIAARLVLARDQAELMDMLRTRRADAVLLDAVAAHGLNREVEVEPVALVRRQGGPDDRSDAFRHRFALVVPASSMRFTVAQAAAVTVAVVDPGVYPASAAVASLFWEDLGLSRPLFRFVDTESSVLKGVAYGLNDAGVVSEELLGWVDFAEYVRHVRVLALSDPVPSWVIVVRRDWRSRDHQALRRALYDLSSLGTLPAWIKPVSPEAAMISDAWDILLLDRAVDVWRAGYVTPD